MQQFQNPNYMMYQQPQYNPYLQRMENLQQFQQVIQPMATNQMPTQTYNPFGKVVESMDIVKVTDIPMDGNMYYFPQADGQAIYGKKFLPNGQTQILAFKPVLENEPNNLSNEDGKTKMVAFDEVLGAIRSEIKAINDKIDKIGKPTRAKKEVAEDE